MENREFIPFDLPHCTAMAVTVAATALMIWLNGTNRVSPGIKRAANTILAIILVAEIVVDPFLTWRRNAGDPELAALRVRQTALPFYLCDLASIVLAVALVWRKQRWAELGYLWGMAGTLQGLITPTLQFSWDQPEYYAFFAQHGGVIVASMALAFGTDLKPAPGALRRAVLWSWAYLAGGYVVNWLLNANYGFINAKPEVDTLFNHLGPYPWYLLTLQGIGIAMYLILLLPFMPRWKKERGEGSPAH